MKFLKIISVSMCVLYLSSFILLSSGCSGTGAAKSGSPGSTGGTAEAAGNGAAGAASGAEAAGGGAEAAAGSAEAAAGSAEAAAGSGAAAADSAAVPVGSGETSDTYTPVKIEAKVKPYKVKGDLSNITNLAQFGSFTEGQKKLLSQNGFVVAPSDDEQLFYTYEKNQYLKLPSFVTSDSVLQVYHVFFDYSLRTLEAQKLFGVLDRLTTDLLDKSIYFYGNIKNGPVKAEALKNIAYFAAAQLTLEKSLPDNIPSDAKKLAQAELSLINDARGFDVSPIFGCKLDYSQYKPRGHYTRSHDFEKFFKAMMWYGQAPFSFYKGKDSRSDPDYVMAARSILMTYSVFTNYKDMPDSELWDKIYSPTAFYVGTADDLTIYDIKALILKVYGSEMDLDSIMDKGRLESFYKELDKLPAPRIQAQWSTVDTPAGKQFRFMGQRYIPDSEILQRLVDSDYRPMPSGLDVMGVLGSDRAYSLLVDRYDLPGQWPDYPGKFKAVKDDFLKLPESKWQSNMYYGWLWTLKSLITPYKAGHVLFSQGYPSFMTNAAWTDKSLSTALGSWAELRHDTILYGKQSGAECGGGEAPPVIKSYVEPNVELYSKLLWLTRYSRENLTKRDILPEDLQNRMQAFENLLDFLTGCSIKELKNEELTKEEYDSLLTYGGTLEYLTSSFADNGMRWFEITSDTDKNMAVIADVHTVPGTYLEEAVGPASQIFVTVPIGGKLYLTRGAIFSYYEFASTSRLTDEEWQKLFKEQKQPLQPAWTDTFISGEKTVETIPVPEEPYESGC